MPRIDKVTEARRVLEWSDLAIIQAIGRAGSLSGAARVLGKTHSTVFRNINSIEEKPVSGSLTGSIVATYRPTQAEQRSTTPRGSKVSSMPLG